MTRPRPLGPWQREASWAVVPRPLSPTTQEALPAPRMPTSNVTAQQWWPCPRLSPHEARRFLKLLVKQEPHGWIPGSTGCFWQG